MCEAGTEAGARGYLVCLLYFNLALKFKAKLSFPLPFCHDHAILLGHVSYNPLAISAVVYVEKEWEMAWVESWGSFSLDFSLYT